MKRSEMNAIMQDADAFIWANGFHLPPFAYWTADDWRGKGPEAAEIVPGELYHQFWAEESRVLVGEGSQVNDDAGDNRFLEPVGRFPSIEEDATPLYLLVADYPAYYRTRS